jgi:phage repressor protein C with HTH and peptisase S24 domain
VNEESTRDNLSPFVDRLQQALVWAGVSQAALAKRAGVSTSVMTKYLQGSEPGLFRAARLADVLGVSLHWLATGEGPPNAEAVGFFSVPLFDVQLAAGAANFSDGAQQLGEMPLDRDLLSRLGRSNADGLAAVVADGDSMEPLIRDGARILIDLRDCRLREGIFSFRMGDELRVKRLRRLAEGIEVLSENPRYEPERLAGDKLRDFAIIGRVLMTVTVL